MALFRIEIGVRSLLQALSVVAALTLALDAEGRSNSIPNERANRNFGFGCYKKDFTGVKKL